MKNSKFKEWVRRNVNSVTIVAAGVTVVGGIIVAIIQLLPDWLEDKDAGTRKIAYETLSKYIGELKVARRQYTVLVVNGYDQKVATAKDTATAEEEFINIGHSLVKVDCHELSAKLEEAFRSRGQEDWQVMLNRSYHEGYVPFLKHTLIAYKQGKRGNAIFDLSKEVDPAIEKLDHVLDSLRNKL